MDDSTIKNICIPNGINTLLNAANDIYAYVILCSNNCAAKTVSGNSAVRVAS